MFLQLGLVLGLVAGLAHAIDIHRRRAKVVGPAAALYPAFWAVVLWTLFGAYLLAFWLIGLIGMAVAGLWRAVPAR